MQEFINEILKSMEGTEELNFVYKLLSDYSNGLVTEISYKTEIGKEKIIHSIYLDD